MENGILTRRAYRVYEIAPILGISRSEAYLLVSKGHIRSIRKGRMIFIPVEAISEFLGETSDS